MADFVTKKFEFTRQLLSQFTLSKSLIEYTLNQQLTDDGVVSLGQQIGLKPVNTGPVENLVLFSLVFDLFDCVVDLETGMANKPFGEKVAAFTEHNSQLPNHVMSSLDAELYDFCVNIRNKLIHSNASINDCNEQLRIKRTGPNDDEFTVKLVDFGLLNQLTFHAAIRIKEERQLNLYEQSVIVSMYRHIFAEANIGAADSVQNEIPGIEEIFVNQQRHFVDLSKRSLTADTKVFDVIAVSAQPYSDESLEDFLGRCPDPEKRVIQANYTYRFCLDGDYFLFPAELIHREPQLTFAQLSAWRE